MDKLVLKKYIDKVQGIYEKSTTSDSAEALKLYHTFCWTLDPEWHDKYVEYFNIVKKIDPATYKDALPDDGFFYHLFYGVIYAHDLCQIDHTCKEESTVAQINEIAQNKKSLDECLEQIKLKYCLNTKLEQKEVDVDDIRINTSRS